jgi:hypothetical protein
MPQRYPQYYSVNDRPVKLVKTPDGGMDVLALDVSTGNFTRELEQLAVIFQGGRDVDALTEEEFDKLVQWHRARLGL